MRREHASILTDVLTSLAQYIDEAPGKVHVTVLAARANLPHDRLKAYLGELVAAGLVETAGGFAVTRKGRQFLDCHHAWRHILRLYGLAGSPAEAPPQVPLMAVRRPPFTLGEPAAAHLAVPAKAGPDAPQAT